MVWNEISRFLQEFHEKNWKNIKFIQILQNRIYFVKKKFKKVYENKWNKNDKTSLPYCA